MTATRISTRSSTPWRPPLWPFHITDRQGMWLSWVARIWLAVMTAIFATQALRGQIPQSLEPAPNETTIQLALFAVVILGEIVAWKWKAIGASIITAGAIALGVMAAIEHSPRYALMVALAFFLPAFLYWLDWQHTRSITVIVLLAGSLAMVLALGGYQASATYQRYNGPTHPQSDLKAEAVTLVEWVWSGAQTTDAFRVNAGLARDSDAVYLAVSEYSDLRDATLFGPATANAAGNRVVSFKAEGLRPDTRYYYAVQADGERDLSRQGRVNTFGEGAFSFTFAVGACAITGSNGQVFDRIRESEPLFFLATGDIFYENIGANNPNTYRAAYKKILTAPAQAALYRSTGYVYSWDDHDFGPNNSDRTSPSRDAAQQVYRQVVPHYELAAGDTGPIYRAFTAGRVRFIVMDTRSEKDPSTDADTAAKSMIGAAQKAWFKQELLAARDTHALIVWVNSVPWIGPASGTAEYWAGYATERQELANFIAEHRITNLMMLSGDAHMVALDDGTNTDYSSNGGAAFPILHAAALDRRGSTKGGPFTGGAFPGGGQFGLVQVADNGSTVTVTMAGRNYKGDVLVSHTFTVPAAHVDATPEQTR